MLQILRLILGFSCLTAWLWLILRSYGDPTPFIFNDEFGRLAMVLPMSAVFLAALGLERHLRKCPVSRRWVWNVGCAALCAPLLLQLRALAPAAWLVDWTVSLLGGFGFAVGFLTLGVSAARCSRSAMLGIACGGIIVTSALMQTLPALQPGTLLLMPVILALGARLFLEPESGAGKGLPDGEEDTAWACACPPAGHREAPLWAILLLLSLAGFSHGLYSSMLAVMEPLLPSPQPSRSFLLALNVGVAAACIQLARRSVLWRAALLTGPLLMVGYTAWPLLHRESLALSLGGLHFAQIFLGIFCLVTLFSCAAHQDGGDGGWRFLGLGTGAVLAGLLLGFSALPCVRESFSHGITVNSIFALLAVAVLLSYWGYVLLLGRMEFWTGPRTAGPDRLFPRVFEQEPSGEARSEELCRRGEERPPEPDAGECEEIFRTFGLTRQQALIAAMLAQKGSDAEICAALNISPNTLKTHIRNILHRLHINSRHELPWLVSHVRGAPSHGEPRAQGDDAEA